MQHLQLFENKEFNRVCNRAIQWGVKTQMAVLLEEASELQRGIGRYYTVRADMENIKEEMADTLILVYQISMILGTTKRLEEDIYGTACGTASRTALGNTGVNISRLTGSLNVYIMFLDGQLGDVDIEEQVAGILYGDAHRIAINILELCNYLNITEDMLNTALLTKLAKLKSKME